MAHEKFPVEILSPEGEVWSGEVEMVSTRTTTGSIGILANHTPLLAMLDPTELRLYESESEVIKFAQAEGYLQVGGNRALMLVEEAHPPDDLDRAELETSSGAPSRSSSRPRRGPRPRASPSAPSGGGRRSSACSRTPPASRSPSGHPGRP